jgi:hypothetical protein
MEQSSYAASACSSLDSPVSGRMIPRSPDVDGLHPEVRRGGLGTAGERWRPFRFGKDRSNAYLQALNVSNHAGDNIDDQRQNHDIEEKRQDPMRQRYAPKAM